MTFPIFYQGRILFRNGKPAFSANCCCDVNYTHKSCIVVRLGGVGTPDDIDVTPPLRGSGGGLGKIVFHGNSKDTEFVPFGSQYHTIYWIIEYCGVASTDADVYEVELEQWARNDGMIALTGFPDNIVGTSYSDKLLSCSDEVCNEIIDQLRAPPGVPFVRTIFTPLQPRVRCPNAIIT